MSDTKKKRAPKHAKRGQYKAERDELALALSDLLKRIDCYFGRDPQSLWKEERQAKTLIAKIRGAKP